MTTPGGVPNLPPGALTLDTLASDTQDVSQPAMKARAAGRFSSIFSSSTGLSPSSDITPFGILTSIFAGFNSTVANADPADVDGPEDLPGLLLDFIESLPFVGQFVGLFEAIIGEYDGDDETLLAIQALFAPIRALVDAVTSVAGDTFIDFFESLLSGGSPLDALNLFGQLPQSLFGLIPASSIGGTNPNLLTNGGFDGAVSMDGAGVWTWDASVGHTSPGSAKTTANSTLKALVSTPVSVTSGQALSPSVWVKTSGYTGSGTPIRLAVRTYLSGVVVGTTIIQSVAGPGSTWTQLSGSYTVPSGVDSVAIRLVVDTTATGGTVYFDDANLSRPGNGPFDGILDLFNLGSLEDLFSLNPVTIWTAIINLFLKPSNLLATLTGGILPDSQRPQMLQDAVDNIFDAWNSGVQGSTANNPLSNLFSAVFGINRTGTSAQSVNTVQDSAIAALQTGTSGLSETFDGSAGALDTTYWEQTYGYGSGGGSDGLSGSGTCKWSTSGASTRGCQNRYKTALTTDTQLVQITTTSNVGFSTIGSHPSFRIQGRMDSTRQNYVEARVTNGSAEIGYYLSGTYTRLGSAVSIGGSTAGTWTLKLGTTVSTRQFLLLQNGVTVVTQTDGGAASVMGSSNYYTGFSHLAGVQYLGGIIFLQMAPPELESFGAADRLAAL